MDVTSLSFLTDFTGQSAYGLLVDSLYEIPKYLAKKTTDEAVKKLFIEPLLKRVLPKSKESKDGSPTVTKSDISDHLAIYLEGNNRALETTLRCLEQLADRVDKLDKSVSTPVFVALGLSTPSNATPQNDAHVQDVVNDRAPGLPQAIKSGYALLHLRRGNNHLAEIYARSAISINPTEPRAWYALGLLKLRHRITEISPPNADEAERYLATASEAGLASQCATPRAALRFDHYVRKGRKLPAPDLHSLGSLFGAHYQEAVSWPYGALSDGLLTSLEFRRLWKGK